MDYFVDIDAALALLNQGRALLVPTDTVWGIALKVDCQSDPELLFVLKHRDRDKAIPWLVAAPSELEHYCQDLPAWARALADHFWPGALTLVCRASAAAPTSFIAADGSLALRMPCQTETLELIRRLGAPLATSSANRQGLAPAKGLADLDDALIAEVGAVLRVADTPTAPPPPPPPDSISAALTKSEVVSDGTRREDSGDLGPAALPSTIVSCLGDQPLIQRVGSLDPALVLGFVKAFME